MFASNLPVKIKLLDATGLIPTKAHKNDAGYDIYAAEDYVIPAGECIKISTQIACEIPEGVFAAMFARSGLATNSGLGMANGVGVIDSNYRGEWLVPLRNFTPAPQFIKQGERIAQVIFLPYYDANFVVVDNLTDSERSVGGFGSSGRD